MNNHLTEHKYINLETYRKTGAPVATPVWFVQDQKRVYVRTIADSGKVKRIRNNPQVRIAPCDVRGGLLGNWQLAHSGIVDADTAQSVNRWLRKKYGLQKMLFDWMGKFNRSESVTLFIELDERMEAKSMENEETIG